LRKSLLFAAIFVGLSAVSGNAQASGQIYLLRGLAGIFSTGLDALDGKLVQRGFNATVHGYDYYEGLAQEAAQLQKSGKGPIVIIGHSLGADAAIFMAEKMKAAGAPVALVVTFGPTVTLVAPSNVSQVINYYAGNTIVTKGPRFKGTISNVDLNSAPDINHLNVEKSNRLHAAVISKIQAIAGRGRTGSVAGHGRTSPTAEQGRAPTGVQGRASPAATVQ
jgi:predicted alpha/beta hydrolase family esterase